MTNNKSQKNIKFQLANYKTAKALVNKLTF